MCVLHQPDVTFRRTGHNVAASSAAKAGHQMGPTSPQLRDQPVESFSKWKKNLKFFSEKVPKNPKKVTDYEHSQHCYDSHAIILYGHMTEHSPTVHRPVHPKMHSCLKMVKLKQNKRC